MVPFVLVHVTGLPVVSTQVTVDPTLTDDGEHATLTPPIPLEVTVIVVVFVCVGFAIEVPVIVTVPTPVGVNTPPEVIVPPGPDDHVTGWPLVSIQFDVPVTVIVEGEQLMLTGPPPGGVTWNVTVRITFVVLPSITEWPVNVIVPVCVLPAGKLVELAVMVIVSKPPLPICDELDAGLKVSQELFDTADQVNSDPGAPVLVNVTVEFPGTPPATALTGTGFGVNVMLAIGSQRRTNCIFGFVEVKV